MTFNGQVRGAQVTGILLFVIMTLLILSLQTLNFENLPYRQDETWHIHLALLNTLPGTVREMANNIQPPLWHMLIKLYVDWFGHAEKITRFSSTLISALTLACTFRLAKDLFDRQTALLAVAMLGATAIFLHFGHEARPYTLLALLSAAAPLTFLRWLRHPNFWSALVFVITGILLIYTHFFSVYMFCALVVYFVLFVRWNTRLYLTAFGLFTAILLAYAPWIPPTIHAALVLIPGGIDYGTQFTTLEQITSFVDGLHIRPSSLGWLFMLMAVVQSHPNLRTLPDDSRFRYNPHWRLGFVLTVPLFIIVLALLLNQLILNVLPRNFIVLSATTAVLAAVGARTLPIRLRLLVPTILLAGAALNFPILWNYDDVWRVLEVMSQFDQAGSQVIIDGDEHKRSDHVLLGYYLNQVHSPAKAKEDFFFIMQPLPSTEYDVMALRPRWAMDGSAESLRQFSEFLTADQVWHIVVKDGTPDTAIFERALMDQQYRLFRTTRVGGYFLNDYRRIPATAHVQFRFGDAASLQAWRRADDNPLHPCQSITVESWWQTSAPLPDDYSMTLVLADASGVGVARQDNSPAGIETTLWQPDVMYVDARALSLPCDLAAGDYSLLVGWYDSGKPGLPSLLIQTPDGDPIGDLLYLTTLTVE